MDRNALLAAFSGGDTASRGSSSAVERADEVQLARQRAPALVELSCPFETCVIMS